MESSTVQLLLFADDSMLVAEKDDVESNLRMLDEVVEYGRCRSMRLPCHLKLSTANIALLVNGSHFHMIKQKYMARCTIDIHIYTYIQTDKTAIHCVSMGFAQARHNHFCRINGWPL